MAKNLSLDKGLNNVAQPIKDEDGKVSPLTISTEKVGIGTTDPQAKLHLESATGDVIQRIRAGSKNTASLQLVEDNSPSGFSFDYHGDPNRLDITSIVTGKRSQRVSILRGSGNVGIGTTNAERLLHIHSSPGVGPQLRLSDSNGHWQLWGGGDFVIQEKDETRVIIRRKEKGGNFEVLGNIVASGDIQLAGADCAEEFNVDANQALEPGTVMVIGNEDHLQSCSKAYDKRVAGVLSGAGDYKPGIVLDKQQSTELRKPLALTGKVFCKVDAQYGAIEVGDLLTTSLTPGFAMKVLDPLKAFGAVIGKALRPLKEGQGLVPILIALQ